VWQRRRSPAHEGIDCIDVAAALVATADTGTSRRGTWLLAVHHHEAAPAYHADQSAPVLSGKSEAERTVIARQHFQAYARSALERGILWWASEARLKRLIKVEPGVPFETLSSGPTILLCPHFVCLEIPGIALVLNSQFSVCTIYSRQQNKIVDDALLKGRSRFRPVTLLAREKGVKPIIRAMREGLPFIMLPDMDFGIRDGEFVPFFGVPTATLSAPARIAAATNANVIPVITTYLPGYKGWKTTFYPAWETIRATIFWRQHVA